MTSRTLIKVMPVLALALLFSIVQTVTSSDVAHGQVVANPVLLTKTVSPTELVEPGGTVTFEVAIENQRDASIIVNTLVDDIHGDLNGQGDCVVPQIITDNTTHTCSFTADITGVAGDIETDTITATGTSHNPDSGQFPFEISDSATVTIIAAPGGDPEGCLALFWMQRRHVDDWVGYAPGDDFATVFGVTLRRDRSLMRSLHVLPFTKRLALNRQAVAGILNASNPDVDYHFTEAEVIAMVQDAYATGDYRQAIRKLFRANKQGCPLR